MIPVPPQVVSRIREESSLAAPPGLAPLVHTLVERYGKAVQAILFYGSCRRTGQEMEGVVDLYVLVDTYRSAPGNIILSLLNRLFPPNVYYMELPLREGVVRAKYAVISLTDFQKGTSTAWFQSYLWARFAQPVRLVYAQSEEVAQQVYTALARAVLTFVTRVLPRVPQRFTARDLWHTGFLLTYQSDLRAERRGRLSRLVDAEEDYYEDMTRLCLAAVPYEVEVLSETPPVRYRSQISGARRLLASLAWQARFVQGKCLTVLRLLKGAITFKGGPDYVLWKIERHSGVSIPRDSFSRRHPVIGIWVILWRLYRRKAFR